MKKRTGIKRLGALLLAALLLSVCLNGQSVTAWGDRGEDVMRIQQRLKQYGYYAGTVDGIFGKSTYDAVVRFQKNNGLRQDGAVGSATAAALGVQLDSAAAQADAAESEVYVLARLVHGEARGEPYLGKVAVAAVVLNRVKNAAFPNTISGVIFQSGAFDAVKDGQIWLTPDSDCIRAAHDALNGWDPTNGCLYYYNPATATNAWIWTREVRLTIGDHAFAV